MHTRSLLASVLGLGLVALIGCTTPVTTSSRIAAPADSYRLFRGSLEGREGHTVTGSVRVIGDGAGTRYVAFDNSFNVSNAPDMKVGFGNEGKIDRSSLFTILDSNRGAQTYQIPDRIDVTAYDQVFIWSDELGQVLGVATLRR